MGNKKEKRGFYKQSTKQTSSRFSKYSIHILNPTRPPRPPPLSLHLPSHYGIQNPSLSSSFLLTITFPPTYKPHDDSPSQPTRVDTRTTVPPAKSTHFAQPTRQSHEQVAEQQRGVWWGGYMKPRVKTHRSNKGRSLVCCSKMAYLHARARVVRPT